jgi:hypothetical protein
MGGINKIILLLQFVLQDAYSGSQLIPLIIVRVAVMSLRVLVTVGIMEIVLVVMSIIGR